MELISRKEAKSLGLSRYYTGKPCKNGHLSPQYVNGNCVACDCSVERQATQRQHKRNRHKADWRREILAKAKQRAKIKKIPFAISLDDIDIPLECPWLKIPLFSNEGKFGPNSPSLDRVLPELGYVKGNIIVISHLANTIKQNASWQQIQAVADGVRKVVENG